MVSKEIIKRINLWLARKKYTHFIFFVITLISFTIILYSRIPEDAVRFFNRLDFRHFVVFIVIFSFTLNSDTFLSRFIESVLVSALFAIPLSVRWELGITNANIIAGFIPYKDGFYYYNGAQRLLAGYPIAASGVNGAFRPLMPGFLSVFLWMFNNNLQIILALINFLAAYSLLISVRAFKEKTAPVPSALLLVFLYAFIKPIIGYTLTEIPGFMFSCLAFFFLIKYTDSGSWIEVLSGTFLLVLANSIRAGAFFMLPALLLYFFLQNENPGPKKFQQLIGFAVWILFSFLIANIVVPRILTESSVPFGNFSWMLYGQAVGGAGWMAHMEALGTSDPAVVLQAALQKILTYPLGFVIGAVKSYRDLFYQGDLSIFDLFTWRNKILSTAFWLTCLCLTLIGIYFTAKKRKDQTYALVLLLFAGIFLSVPFLPPVDGGNRFYAGSIPFFYAMPAVGLYALQSVIGFDNHEKLDKENKKTDQFRWIIGLSLFLILAATLFPAGLLLLKQSGEYLVPACSGEQIPVNLKISSGSYVDIVRDIPFGTEINMHTLRLSRFEVNNFEKEYDDFNQELIRLGNTFPEGIRFAAVVERNSLEYYFAVIPLDLLRNINNQVAIIGCAEGLETQFQHILLIKEITN